MSNNQDKNNSETFREEAYEHLSLIEETLLDLEEMIHLKPDQEKVDHAPSGVHRPLEKDRSEKVNSLFRSIHTIKGAGAMFGFEDIAQFAHHAESVLDRVREGDIPLTTDLINLLFIVKDQIKKMLDPEAADQNIRISVCEQITEQLKAFLPENETEDEEGQKGTISPFPEENHEEIIYRIRFQPHPGLMLTGMDPFLLLDELRGLGEADIFVNPGNVPFLEKLDPESMYLCWDILLVTEKGMNAIRDVFIFVENDSRITIQPLDEQEMKTQGPRPLMGEILVNRGDTDEGNVKQALQKQKRLGEILVQSGTVTREAVISALKEQKIIEKKKVDVESKSVRISSEKLDDFMNLVGQLVITQAHLNNLTDDQGETVFSAPIKQLERLTNEMREFALGIRMLPIGTLFNGFRRLVRDISQKTGKEVELILEGSETELDKAILEKLHDPLVHLIRNSIDHGIRKPEEREKHGKQRKGTIRLSASHKGSKVNIVVSDDGMGIDTDAVMKKAREKGLASGEAEAGDEIILNLLFVPGLSTAGNVTDVSGRGVGMDVVKQEINALRGNITLQNVKGKGVSFHISVPLTLAIIEGLHVVVAGRDYIIPVFQVDACAEMKGKTGKTSQDNYVYRLKGELLPFIRLRDFFSIPGGIPDEEHIVSVHTGLNKIGIVVDRIAGNIQTVIKPLDPIYRNGKGISGATIMGNGTMALIIDLQEIIRYEKEKN